MCPDPLQRGLTRSGDISAFLHDYKGSPPPLCSPSASSLLRHSWSSALGFVSRVRPGSTAGIREGSEEAHWTDARTHYLSPFKALRTVPGGGNNAPAGMRCDRLALDAPEGSGSRPGGLICAVRRGLICSGGRSYPGQHLAPIYRR